MTENESGNIYVFKKGKLLGAFTLAEINRMLAQNVIDETDSVYMDSWGAFKPVKCLPGVKLLSDHPFMNVKVRRVPLPWYKRIWRRVVRAWIDR